MNLGTFALIQKAKKDEVVCVLGAYYLLAFDPTAPNFLDDFDIKHPVVMCKILLHVWSICVWRALSLCSSSSIYTDH